MTVLPDVINLTIIVYIGVFRDPGHIVRAAIYRFFQIAGHKRAGGIPAGLESGICDLAAKNVCDCSTELFALAKLRQAFDVEEDREVKGLAA